MDIYQFAEYIVLNYGYFGIFLIAFTEAVIQPVIPDIFIIGAAAFGLDSVTCAFVASFGSLTGGYTGYFLGKKLGTNAFLKIFKEKNFIKGKAFFEKFGVWGVAIAGFTPIPYKVFAWLAGIFKMNLLSFGAGTLLGRIPRFLLVAYFGYSLGMLFGLHTP
ncbi:YqaA family protein [Methanococcus maripaludis]|uniref:Membrane protein YqaA with SNARE-associated domain n=2 Tax=Methanococcus maripaludis TaxID=39152 RepID=A0A7J9PGU0_METMI|nr:YqaA family protein [Methanococcus maripaludis]MBA2861927.1 membrane protein YqaA with SNARE-associated domain [Methanococcus maripaludis]